MLRVALSKIQRRYHMVAWLSILLAILFSSTVLAQTTAPFNSNNSAVTPYQATLNTEQPLNHSALILHGVPAEHSIIDVQAAFYRGEFVPAEGQSVARDNTKATWLRLDLVGHPEAQEWYLLSHAVSQKDLQLFIFQPGATNRQHVVSGNMVPFASGRSLPYRHTNVLLNLNPEQPTTVYLRYFDRAGSIFPVTLISPEALVARNLHEHLGFGIIFGIILGLMLYNLVLWVSLRDSLYGWYIFTTAAALMLALEGTNFGFQYLFSEHGVPRLFDRTSISAVWGIAVLIFAQQLLRTKQHLPKRHFDMNITIAVFAIIWLSQQLGWFAISSRLAPFFALIGIALLMLVAIQRLRQGNQTALFFIVGHGIVLLAALIMVLRTLGIVAPQQISTYLFPAAVAFESIIFSLALAHRIRQLQAQHAAAVNVAMLDPLTNINNRRGLNLAFEQFCARQQGEVALILLDLNGFKKINDTRGHDIGDAVLQEVTARLQNLTRSRDCIARLGGDEFAILIQEQDVKTIAEELLQRLQQHFQQPAHINGLTLSINAAFGMACAQTSQANFAELYQQADKQLYQAKLAG